MIRYPSDQLNALLTGRRTVRRFLDMPVPEDDLLAILEAARWAPSPHGRQPWRFVVLTQPEPKQYLAEAMGVEWQAQLALDNEAPERVVERLRLSKLRISTAPALVIPCLMMADMDVYPDAQRRQAEEIMAVQSLGCAVQNMLLMAFARGLDAGWMCAPLFCQATVRLALNLPEALQPHALIPLGYAAAEPQRRPRKPLEELIIWR